MMKLSELAKYCEEIEIDCDRCNFKATCKRMVDYMEDQSPVGIIKAVQEDMEF